MKYHKYYKERIASFLTTFELNPSSISQRWIENKFYSLDGERISNFRQRFNRENARFSLTRQIRNPTPGQKTQVPIKIYDANIVIDWDMKTLNIDKNNQRDLHQCQTGYPKRFVQNVRRRDVWLSIVLKKMITSVLEVNQDPRYN